MVEVPADTPVIDPPYKSAVAVPEALLFQTPPVTGCDNATELPSHTTVVPVMEAIAATTVTVFKM